MADYTLPELAYDYSALEPSISGTIMELHHSKHHQAYVTGANTALAQLAEARDIGQPRQRQQAREGPRVQPRRPRQPLDLLDQPLARRRRQADRRARRGDRRPLRLVRQVPRALHRDRARRAGLRLGRARLGLHRPAPASSCSSSTSRRNFPAGIVPLLHARRLGARVLPRLQERARRLREGVLEHRQLGERPAALRDRAREDLRACCYCRSGWCPRTRPGTPPFRSSSPSEYAHSRTCNRRHPVSVKIGINGFGRIGRNYFRAALAKGSDLEIVAVNDLTDNKTLAHLLKYDSITGRLDATVELRRRQHHRQRQVDQGASKSATPRTCRGATSASTSSSSRPARFTKSGRRAQAHRRRCQEGPRSRLPPPDDDATFVLGVNEGTTTPSVHDIISNASCTTNCLAPLAKVFNDEFGIERGLMTTVHAYTADQNLQDGPHSDLRRARAAAVNIIPTSTGAAKAIGLVLPELVGKLDGFALRVPVPTGSITDLTVTVVASGHGRRGQRRLQGRRRGPAQGHPEVHRRRDRLERHRLRPALLDLRRRPAPRPRRPGEARVAGTTTSGATPTASSTSTEYVAERL